MNQVIYESIKKFLHVIKYVIILEHNKSKTNYEIIILSIKSLYRIE